MIKKVSGLSIILIISIFTLPQISSAVDFTLRAPIGAMSSFEKILETDSINHLEPKTKFIKFAERIAPGDISMQHRIVEAIIEIGPAYKIVKSNIIKNPLIVEFYKNNIIDTSEKEDIKHEEAEWTIRAAIKEGNFKIETIKYRLKKLYPNYNIFRRVYNENWGYVKKFDEDIDLALMHIIAEVHDGGFLPERGEEFERIAMELYELVKETLGKEGFKKIDEKDIVEIDPKGDVGEAVAGLISKAQGLIDKTKEKTELALLEKCYVVPAGRLFRYAVDFTSFLKDKLKDGGIVIVIADRDEQKRGVIAHFNLINEANKLKLQELTTIKVIGKGQLKSMVRRNFLKLLEGIPSENAQLKAFNLKKAFDVHKNSIPMIRSIAKGAQVKTLKLKADVDREHLLARTKDIYAVYCETTIAENEKEISSIIEFLMEFEENPDARLVIVVNNLDEKEALNKKLKSDLEGLENLYNLIHIIAANENDLIKISLLKFAVLRVKERRKEPPHIFPITGAYMLKDSGFNSTLDVIMKDLEQNNLISSLASSNILLDLDGNLLLTEEFTGKNELIRALSEAI